MAGFRIEGNTSGNVAEVNASNQIKVVTETNVAASPATVGAVRTFGENDAGSVTGEIKLVSTEVDIDYRSRVAPDLTLDEHIFNYTAQDTGKHSFSAATMAASWTAGQFTTNSTSITTIATGVQLETYATFPNIGTQTLSFDTELAFSAQPTTNTFIEFGIGIPGTNLIAPTDGVFFRLNSSGLVGVISNNGTEIQSVFPLSGGTGTWAYTNDKRYQFICYAGGVEADFWVNDGTGAVKLGTIPLPSGLGRICMAGGLKAFFKHRIVGGAAGGVIQAKVGAYNVRLGGTNLTSTVSTQGNRIYGSYQGQSGGTMGSLANYANSANPVAAVPTNTTAALGVGLGGQFWETATLAVNTDGIICSYQIPLATANFVGKRLVIRGVGLTSYIQTAITGGPFISQYSLAFGHTTVSLATAEGAATKASRRIPLAGFTQAVTAAQAVSTIVSQPGGSFVDFGDAPIFVNPGEFVALVTKHIGTVATAGTIAHVVTFVYGWE